MGRHTIVVKGLRKHGCTTVILQQNDNLSQNYSRLVYSYLQVKLDVLCATILVINITVYKPIWHAMTCITSAMKWAATISFTAPQNVPEHTRSNWNL